MGARKILEMLLKLMKLCETVIVIILNNLMVICYYYYINVGVCATAAC